MNETKAAFDKIPRHGQVDENGLDAVKVLAVLDSNDISPSAVVTVKKQIDQDGTRKATFGELAPLIRGGTQGLLSEKDASALKSGLLSASPAAGIRGLSKESAEEDIIDALHSAFLSSDPDSSGVIAWKDLKTVASLYLDGLPGVATSENGHLIAELPLAPPSPGHTRLDFEDWFATSSDLNSLAITFSSLSLSSVCLLTTIQADNLNDAKDAFSRIPNKLDDGDLPIVRVQHAIENAAMSVKSSRMAKKMIDRHGHGTVTFGEVALLIRGGATGMLPAKHAKSLKGQLLLDSVNTMPFLVRHHTAEELINQVFQAFEEHDHHGNGLIPWEEWPKLVEKFARNCGVSESDITVVLNDIPAYPPSVTQEELDFEDW